MLKEQLLLRDRGVVEEGIQLVPTPQAVVSEGIAETARKMVDGAASGEELVGILQRHGLEVDHRTADVAAAAEPLGRVGLDVALMIHEEGASPEQAEAYARRWALSTPQHARQTVRFVTDRTWRAYAVTYAAGAELVRAYTCGDPARFRRLLTEHVRVRELVAERDLDNSSGRSTPGRRE